MWIRAFFYYYRRSVFMNIKPLLSRQKICYLACAALFRASFGYALYVVRTRLSVFEYDMAGHIASARLFRENGFHNFSEQRFGGFIQNLFYPPLEDAVVSILFSITNNRFTAFQLFLSFGILWYGAAGRLLAHRMKTPVSRLLFLVFIVLFARFGRAGTYTYQGMGMYDFFIVWLTSQLRGAVFFMLLVRERSGKKRDWVLLLSTVWAILSHLVMGMAACGFLSVAIVIRRLWKPARVFLAAVGITAFFRLPFLGYTYMLTSSAILITPPGITVLVVILALFMSTKDHKGYEYILTAMVFLVPWILQVFRSDIPLPRFHRYRLHSSALLLIGYGLLLGITPKTSVRSSRFSYGLSWTLIGLMIVLLWQWGAYRTWLKPMSLEWLERFTHELGVPEHTRVLTFGNKRPGDFHQSTILHTLRTDFQTVGGLFRESHRSNLLISSYMASLLGPGWFVLHGMHATDPTCDHYERIFEDFISRYAIGVLALPDERFQPYLGGSKRACLDAVLQKKNITGSYALSWPVRYTLQQTPFQVYEIAPVPNAWVSNAMIVPITEDMNINYLPLGSIIPLEPIMTGTYEADVFETLRKTVFVTDETVVPEIHAARFEGDTQPISLSMTERRPWVYEITMEGVKTPTAFFMKMHRYPWRRLVDASGKKLPLYDAFYGMIGIGQWTMLLEYKKPAVFRLAYGMSVIALISSIVVLLRKKRAAHG